MNSSRDAILNRLRETQAINSASPDTYKPIYNWSKQEKIARFSECLQQVHGEVIYLENRNWMDWLIKELPGRGLKNILFGSGYEGDQFVKQTTTELSLSRYDQPIENWKPELFNHIDAAVTQSLAGIAETGSLVLWPDPQEPRLMSLVPPVHIALLKSECIYETFAEVIDEQSWCEKMPTNALLISGPSKTADIEQTLAYGIHGPQQLIVLII